MLRSATAILAALVLGPSRPTPAEPLRVRASAVVARCAEAAVRAWPAARGRVQVEIAGPLGAGPADVLVASAVELTRALEGGAAEEGTDEDLARVPWVLQFAPGTAPLRAAEDLARAGHAVTVPDSPASYEARRWAEEKSGARARAANGRALDEAPIALVPLSLAGPGARIATDVPALVARAALSAHPARPDEARSFLRFLSSQAGRTAFAACGEEPR